MMPSLLAITTSSAICSSAAIARRGLCCFPKIAVAQDGRLFIQRFDGLALRLINRDRGQSPEMRQDIFKLLRRKRHHRAGPQRGVDLDLSGVDVPRDTGYLRGITFVSLDKHD